MNMDYINTAKDMILLNLKKIKKININMNCYLCGKELVYDFEINDGVCESCQINKNDEILKEI